MTRLELEQLTGRKLSDGEYRKMELVYMNTEAIKSPAQLSGIYAALGQGGIDILYSLVEERGRLIETVGDLRTELSGVKKENRRLREFREVILKAYEEAERRGARMYDYDGDMEYFQRQLAAKGITKEMLDMDRYIGLTARELQSIVDSAQLKSKGTTAGERR